MMSVFLLDSFFATTRLSENCFKIIFHKSIEHVMHCTARFLSLFLLSTLFHAKLIEMRIFLIGFMGSGKSHNGKKLAKALNYNFIDLDDYIEEKAGKSIEEIFQQAGESYFRHLEQECLKSMTQFDDIVISTGGGAPCFSDNMAWIKKNGISIFLNPSVNILLHRLLPRTAHRPLLKGKSSEELYQYIHNKLEERVAFYNQADFTITLPNESEDVVKNILQHLQDFFIIFFWNER
ncbi:MAG: shikimate kinase [Saprospiraceae bacterium]|nr:shikimate kinase [Saprospiraceae bacterium]